MVASDDVGRDAWSLRPVLDEVGGLRLVSVALGEVDVVAVFRPAVRSIARVEYRSDSLTGKFRERILQYV